MSAVRNFSIAIIVLIALLGLSCEEGVQSELQKSIKGAESGIVVTLPPGTHEGPVKIDKAVTLKGEDPETCIIELTADVPAVSITSQGPVTIDSVTIKWQLATSERRKGPGCALAVKDTTATIRNCRFIALGGIKRCPSAIDCLGFSNVRIENCRFEGFEFTIACTGGAESVITDSLILNPGHCGATVYSGSKMEVARTIVTGSGYHAIRNTGGTLLAHDNLIINNKNRG
ncbi:MAG: right-handed parallel beta-helix repeat-containing protein, partial [Planctomycetota bacterium]